MRPAWSSLPQHVRDGVEGVLGFPVAHAQSQAEGFSPGVAARVVGAGGERAFVKAASALINDVTPTMHRDEARFTPLLPEGHPSPRFLGSYDDGTWVALVLEDVEGRAPGRPWTPADLDAAVAAIDLQGLVAADPALPDVRDVYADEFSGWQMLLAGPPESLTDWERRHLPDLARLEGQWAAAAEGDRWLHLDARGDNLLVRPDGTAVLVDWPSSAAGAPVLDAVGFIPAAVLDGAVPFASNDPATRESDLATACEELLDRFASARQASYEQVTALVCAFAGLMQWRTRQPPPPGMPTVRAFQAAQGEVALAWLTLRTGWR